MFRISAAANPKRLVVSRTDCTSSKVLSRTVRNLSNLHDSTYQSLHLYDDFQLQPNKLPKDEGDLLCSQERELFKWWSTPRYKYIKRPYTVRDIVTKKGTLHQVYPSSLMAKKLWSLLEDNARSKTPIHTCAVVTS